MLSLTELTKMVVSVDIIQNKEPLDHYLYEGEVKMSQEQMDYYKQLVGDGKAKISVHSEVSESSYGTGGKVSVFVTLTCDQSAAGLSAAIDWAKNMADTKAWEHHANLRNELISRGLLKP